MATRLFDREITIAAPRARVFAELSEPARFLGLQPLLRDVREVAAAPGMRAFEAVEHVRVLGALTVKNLLRVELTPSPAQDRVGFATRAPLGVRLRGTFALEDAGSLTRVRESVSLVCPWLLARFVVREATLAQEALLANLKRRLETPAG